MDIQELKNSEGNVIKVKHGKRTAYYGFKKTGLTDESILCWEVDKKGAVRRSKYGLVHEKVICLNDILEVLSIEAGNWY